MSVACASRFAVLKLEDDEYMQDETSSTLKTVHNITQKNKTNVSKNAAVPTETKTKPKKKKKATNDVTELQSLVFGNGKPKKGGNQSLNNQKAVNAEQWEEWKSKDKEFVSEAYEQDLEQALILSKIDYEKEKESNKGKQPEEQNKSTTSQAQKKKKKNTHKKEKGTMSLNDFQNPPEPQKASKLDVLEDFSNADKCDFFEKIEEDVEKIVTREQRHDSLRERIAQSAITSAEKLKFQEEINLKDEEINLLKQEVEKLKDELKIVKTRNKKLYGILGTGEMREKAEILVDIEKLNSVKDELTEELQEYHAALEQERSKNHALQTELKKIQASRKDRRDSK